MKSIYYTQIPAQTIALGVALGETLKGGDTVLLFGELGTGKTHFAKGIAQGLGITRLVKSPTFVYVNQYPAQKVTLYHYDLYRMEQKADLSSLGYEETLHDPRAINVVEWADRLGENLPTRFIRVDILAKGDTRSIRIDWVYPSRLREESIESSYQEWATPQHVREHCEKVAQVANRLGEAYLKIFQILDLNLLYTSAALHDMARICDFREMDRTKFTEELTEEKWARWQELREHFTGQHHADIAFEALSNRGFTETAEVIRLHKSTALLDEFSSYDSLEKMIMYYADKRVKHTEIVDLAERFRDGLDRHGQYDTSEQRARFMKVEKATYELEKVLFEPIDIDPDDIR